MIFLTLVVLADSLFGDRGIAARMRTQNELELGRRELAAMKHENAGLRMQVRRLGHDPDAIEAVARGELGLIRRGEILILIAR